MKKKNKIILAVVFAVLFIVGLSLGLYFGLRDKPSKTVFADTGTVSVFDEDTVKFSYICPYIENANFEITDKTGFCVNVDGKTVNGKIISIEYNASESEAIESGTVTVTADLEEDLVAGKDYHAVIKANSIELEKEDYVNPDITADFKVKEDDNGVFRAEEEKFKNAKAVVLDDVKAELFKKDGKAYFSITAKGDGLTTYNETDMKNYQVFAAYSYKNENGTFARFLVDDVQFSAENGLIEIIGETGEENLIPGQDYKVTIKKGFFMNDDKTVVNEEYEANFTYIEQ